MGREEDQLRASARELLPSTGECVSRQQMRLLQEPSKASQGGWAEQLALLQSPFRRGAQASLADKSCGSSQQPWGSLLCPFSACHLLHRHTLQT